MSGSLLTAFRRWFRRDAERRAWSWMCDGDHPDGQALLKAAHGVTHAYTAEAEDWGDGTYALWQKDDLINALVELRTVVSDICADPTCPDHGDDPSTVYTGDGSDL